MMKEELEKRMQESVEYHNRLNLKIQEVEAELQNLKNAAQQVIGRVQTYKELMDVTNENGHDPETELLAAVPEEAESQPQKKKS